MLQMTFVNCIAILSNYFGGEVKFVLVAKVNKSLTRIFSEKISECFRINTNASKTWLKYRPYGLYALRWKKTCAKKSCSRQVISRYYRSSRWEWVLGMFLVSQRKHML